MLYYAQDPKRDHNFDNYPDRTRREAYFWRAVICEGHKSQVSFLEAPRLSTVEARKFLISPSSNPKTKTRRKTSLNRPRSIFQLFGVYCKGAQFLNHGILLEFLGRPRPGVCFESSRSHWSYCQWAIPTRCPSNKSPAILGSILGPLMGAEGFRAGRFSVDIRYCSWRSRGYLQVE